MRKNFNVDRIHPMLIAIALMDLDEISSVEKEKVEETDISEIFTNSSNRSHLGRKAKRSKRRKMSIFKERHNYANKEINLAKRKCWYMENLSASNVPIKHRKFKIYFDSFEEEIP